MDDGFEVKFFCGNEGKTVGQIETHLVSEDAECACARTVAFLHSFGLNALQQFKILLHCLLGKNKRRNSDTTTRDTPDFLRWHS